MKKVVLFFSVCAAMGLASCGCGNSCENANADSTVVADTVVATDSVVADTVVAADSTVADSTVADTTAKAE